MVLHLTEAEPRAKLSSIRIERTVDGKPQAWTVDMQAADRGTAEIGSNGPPSRIKRLPAQFANGDRLVIPMLPIDDPDALAARRTMIALAVPGDTFAEPVFAGKPDDLCKHTLGEFVMQAYLDPMIVPNPDLTHIVIHRLSGSGSAEQDIPVDLMQAGQARTALQLGDRVEIPTIQNAPLDRWNGLSTAARNILDPSVSHSIRLTVDGGQSIFVQFDSKYMYYFYHPGPVSSPFTGEGAPIPNLFSATALLDRMRIEPANLKLFTLHLGDQTRLYDWPKLQADDPWMGAGVSVDIQQIAP
jgi:hypothetical protein